MTHGPPQGVLDGCPHGNVGCKHLLQALRRAKLLHCFGYHHEGNGVAVVDWEAEERGTSSLADRSNVGGRMFKIMRRGAYHQQMDFSDEVLAGNNYGQCPSYGWEERACKYAVGCGPRITIGRMRCRKQKGKAAEMAWSCF